MLGIIFTRKRIKAGWVTNNVVKWIDLGQNKSLQVHNGQFLTTLRWHFKHIIEVAHWHAFGNGMTPLESLPLVLVFPGNEFYIDEKEKSAILHWITALPLQWSEIHLSDTSTLLAKSIPNAPQQKFLLFEAFDTDTIFLDTNIPALDTLVRTIDTQAMGIEDAFDNIRKKIIQQLEDKNLTLSERQLEELCHRIEYYEEDKALNFRFLDAYSSINIDIKLTPTRYFDLLTYKRNSYSDILFFLKIFDFLNINIIFASDLYDNPIFKDYLLHNLPSSFQKTNDLYFSKNQVCFDQMLMYFYRSIKAVPPINTSKLTKAKLIAEIKLKCTDKRKYKDYLSKYLPLGQKLSMPDDIVIWYIRQNTFGRNHLSSIGEVILPAYAKNIDESDYEQQQLPPSIATRVHITPVQMVEATKDQTTNLGTAPSSVESEPTTTTNFNDSSSESLLTKPDIDGFATDATIAIVDEIAKQEIAHFAMLEVVYPSNEFVYFKGKLLGANAKEKVFRLLKNSATSDVVEAFHRLYEREKSYYNEVSTIYTTVGGSSYYYRPFYEGEPLEQYVRRVGLNKKYHLYELSAIDLELMLELWRSIYNLKFSYHSLTKDSIIVNVQWRLPFKKILDIKIVNFDTTESTKDAMEQKMTEIFEQLFGENLTHEFKQQFRNA